MMDERMITALAKGMAPFVRECVADAVAPFVARLAEIEARPHEKGDAGEQGPSGVAGPDGPPGPKGDPAEFGSAMLPPEFAAEVAAAARLLHELPSIAVRDGAPRVTRIERDETGALVPVYGESQS
jgi:hypothetical protein